MRIDPVPLRVGQHDTIKKPGLGDPNPGWSPPGLPCGKVRNRVESPFEPSNAVRDESVPAVE